MFLWKIPLLYYFLFYLSVLFLYYYIFLDWNFHKDLSLLKLILYYYLQNYDLKKIEYVLNRYNYSLSNRAEELPIELFIEIANNI